MSRLTGNAYADRQTAGVVVEAESGPVKWSGSSDFTELWVKKPIGDDQGAPYPVDHRSMAPLYGLTGPVDPVNPIDSHNFPVIDRKWTHYSLYRTIDIGSGTTASPKQSGDVNAYYWVADIPVVRVLRVAVASTGSPGIKNNQYVSKFNSKNYGETYSTDLNKAVFLYDETTGTVLSSSGSPSGNQISELELDATGTFWTMGAYDTGTPGNNYIATIGGQCNKVFVVSKSGTTLTAISGNGFSGTDLGKRIVFTDGSSVTITAYIGPTSVTVTNTIPDTTIAYGAVDGMSTYFTDSITDHVLAPDIVTYGAVAGDANHSSWPLLSRTMIEMPAVTQGDVAPGWIGAITRNKSNGFYGELNALLEKHLGYYVPDFQELNTRNDQILRIKAITNGFVVSCKNSTFFAPFNSVASNNDPLTDIVTNYLTQLYPIDEGVGILDSDSAISDLAGNEIEICSDMGIRQCDGTKLGPDITFDLMQSAMLDLHKNFALSSDPVNGLGIYGSKGDLSV
jgi:hypothetical protein